MPRADIVIQVIFNLKEPDKTVIKTNAKEEAVEEILEAWLAGQVGRGKDEREPVKKEEYRVVIGLDLEDDTFSTSSDTGNKNLTCGIIASAFSRLGDLKITGLS